jgi:hypothetical protein
LRPPAKNVNGPRGFHAFPAKVRIGSCELADYLHFVLHVASNGSNIDNGKVAVDRSQLGL